MEHAHVRAEWAVTLAWGLLLAALLALQFLFPTQLTTWELTGGAAGATLLLALVLYGLRRRRAEPRALEVTDTSYATVAAALGAAIAIMGSAFGKWLYLPGLGLLVLGVAGIVRELLAERETRP
jgi:MYXO-CTERM domain-containing protein